MTPLFPSPSEEVLFWMVFLAGLVASRLIEGRGAKQSRASQKKRAKEGPYFLVNSAFVVAIAIAILFGYDRIGLLPEWLLYPGLAIYLLGLLIAYWAASTLGRFYAPTVQVQTDHRVVETGPYRLIRHPIYAASIFSILGIGLALQSWPAVFVLSAVIFSGYAYRIQIEERFLVAELGDDYLQYCKRTKRIIPFIL